MMRAEEEAASIKMIAEMQGQQGGLSGLSNAEEEAASAQMIAEMQRQEGQKQDAASAKLVAEMAHSFQPSAPGAQFDEGPSGPMDDREREQQASLRLLADPTKFPTRVWTELSKEQSIKQAKQL